MFSIYIRRTLLCLLALAISLSSGISYADDTQIYFSSGDNSGNTSNEILPNVIFILDTSGSMISNATGTGKSRIAVLKEAMRTIINSVQDVNLGLMRFTMAEGGPVLFPVSDVDVAAATVVSEPDDTKPSYTYVVTDGNNDAQQRENNQVSLTDTTLIFGEFPATVARPNNEIRFRVNQRFDSVYESGGRVIADRGINLRHSYRASNNLAGVRFNGINIPQGARINSAELDLWTLTRSGWGTARFTIVGHNVDNSPAFVQHTPDLSTRVVSNSTAANVLAVDNDDIRNFRDRFAVTDIVQEIINRPGWVSGNSLSLILHTNTGKSRTFHSWFRSGQYKPRFIPRLIIQYETDARQAVPTTVGLHFPQIIVPQGATVTDAKLVFRSKTMAPNNNPAEWTIRADAADDSAAPTATANNLGARPTTAASVTDLIPRLAQDATYTSTDIRSIVQEVVNRSGWCGGNSMTFLITGTGTRYIHSFDNDNDASWSPKLELTFDGSGPLGCSIGIDTAQIATGTDDAEGSRSGDSQLDFEPRRSIGLRFNNIDIPQGAKMISASITITAREDDTGADTKITIYGEDTDSALTYGNVNSRRKTDGTGISGSAGSILWKPSSWKKDIEYTTPDLKDIVQEIVDRSGWIPGNSMAFIMETTGSNRRGRSYNDITTKAARLSVTFEGGGNTAIGVKTVRQRLIELVNDLPTRGFTPITEVLYEATRYWRGEKVRYGLNREGQNTARLSHPGSYCTAAGSCNGADVVTNPPYGVFEPPGCTTANLNDNNCETRAITGTPNYISPFSSENSCAQNYQVLLSDGEANENEIVNVIPQEYLAGKPCRGQKSDGSILMNDERCSIELAKFLFENDQSITLNNDQKVKTYTVGFDTANLPRATQLLQDIATEGGGAFYEGITATQLVGIFETIINEVKSNPTSFVSPSLATNAFNRLLSRDEVYFGLFTPELNAAWDGNVKKYRVCIESDPDGDGIKDCTLGSILDNNNRAAIDDTTQRFKDTAQSLWSANIDGLMTTSGGSGAEFDDFNERIIYTETTPSSNTPASGTVLSDPGYKITSANWDAPELSTVRDAVCPVNSINTGTREGQDCEDRMLWLLGKVLIIDGSDVDADTRWTINDVLHSSPVIITYGGRDSNSDGVIDTFFDKLVYGSNDGSLHFVNASTGKEEWSFMPQALINNQQSVYTDAEGDHIYGMDITPLLRQKDVDGDGKIETTDGDFVHIIAAMRRGGRNIYALDVSANISSAGGTVVPKFLWRIEGGVSGSVYERLGQTFSKPELGKIATKSNSKGKDVIIFGGGYDEALDSGFGTDASSGADNLGNMIFIVDPEDGSLIFSIGGTGSGANIEVAAMNFAIPSRVKLLDSDGDGLEDRIYVADTGGQIWRVDLANDIDRGDPGSSVVGRLAAISTQGTETDERRFFEPPSVVQVKDTLYAEAAKAEYDYVLLGSGNRANPLNEITQDRFYAFRDYTTGPMTGGSGPSANLAQEYPRSGGAPISHALATDLIDVTTSVLDRNSAKVDASFGWYFDFYTQNSNKAGEKVLSAPITIANTVLFTTYEPNANNNGNTCAANVGGGNAYNFDILTTRATLDWDADGNIEDVGDRRKTLGGGIPSDVVPIFTKEGIVGIVGVEGGASQVGTLNELPRFRTYWYEG